MTIQETIELKLAHALAPAHLEVLNESHMHNVPPGSESHFKVVAVSGQFEGLGLVQRHRLVNRAVAEELAASVHMPSHCISLRRATGPRVRNPLRTPRSASVAGEPSRSAPR